MEHLFLRLKKFLFNLHFLVIGPGNYIKGGLFLGLVFKTAYKPSTRYIID